MKKEFTETATSCNFFYSLNIYISQAARKISAHSSPIPGYSLKTCCADEFCIPNGHRHSQ